MDELDEYTPTYPGKVITVHIVETKEFIPHFTMEDFS